MAEWQCECGFRNKSSNEVCGGNGPMGCKAPAPGGSSFGPARGPKGFKGASPYGFAGKGASKGGKPGEWACDACGFGNRDSNEVCGGNGPMGCKAPRSLGFGGGKGGKDFGGYGPIMKGYDKGFDKGYGKAFDKGYGKGSFGGGGCGGPWMCGSCGFKNSPNNEVCGGNGPMGCKAPQMGGPMYAEPPMAFKGKGFAKGGKPGQWACDACGFSNRDSNEVCGGNGPVGCKAPRSMYAEPPMAFKGKGKMGGNIFSDIKGNGKGKGGGKGEWKCEGCGFSNKPQNTQCGGTGPMGCNAPKPSDWLCDCGFVNKPHNNVCGGEGGKLGCKAEKPEAEDELLN